MNEDQSTPFARVQAQLELARHLHQNNQPEKAASLLQSALQIEPDCATLHAELAMVLASQNKPREAKREAQTALSLDAEEPYHHYVAGYVAACGKDWKAAQKWLKSALEMEPEEAGYWSALSWAQQGARRVSDAIVSARRAIEIDPQDADAHLMLGFALQEKRQVEEARTHFLEALRLDPQNSSAHHGLGVYHLYRGQAAPSLESLAEALRLDADDDAARYNFILAQSANHPFYKPWWRWQLLLQRAPDWVRWLILPAAFGTLMVLSALLQLVWPITIVEPILFTCIVLFAAWFGYVIVANAILSSRLEKSQDAIEEKKPGIHPALLWTFIALFALCAALGNLLDRKQTPAEMPIVYPRKE